MQFDLQINVYYHFEIIIDLVLFILHFLFYDQHDLYDSLYLRILFCLIQ
jgi:hypothetical protein